LAELGGSGAAAWPGGDRLDQQIDIDTGLERKRMASPVAAM
jgi:hypothetical protein